MDVLFAFSKLSLVSLFCVSAVMKARDLNPLVAHLTLTLPLGGRAARALAMSTVAAEAAVIVVLFTAPRLGFAASLVLLTGFTVHLARVLASGTATSCACAGNSDSQVSAIHLIRNAILLAVAAAGLVMAPHSHSGPVAMNLIIAAPAALFGVGMLRLDEMSRFLSPQYTRSS
ncbi:MauE/DoxX family redox-associated membrane protein [Streptomyces prasinus]|uniref:MauE/DoxX family redox-associated membrane protein n=1 Tax=Streptomyces prasinus TaxID=67345 RepID=UPI0006EB6644|nr:MauE/DoxX family redox-associated membrane protein [Streptomyces prasinus]